MKTRLGISLTFVALLSSLVPVLSIHDKALANCGWGDITCNPQKWNHWEQNALASDNVFSLDSRLSGKINSCAAKECDREEQNLKINADGSEIRVDCGSTEITCPGYKPFSFGKGTNGKKADRIVHNSMPYDAM